MQREQLFLGQLWLTHPAGSYLAAVPISVMCGILIQMLTRSKSPKKLASKAAIPVIPGAFFGAGQGDALRFAFANAGREVIAQLGDRLKGVLL